MNRLSDEERGQRTFYSYACMMWNVQGGYPVVVRIHDEYHDRWVGRRCVAALTSFDAPLEMFMKADWRREEAPAVEQAQGVAPAQDARTRYLRAFKTGGTP
jgi:hypothetical protein